jgi:hypothetical protein
MVLEAVGSSAARRQTDFDRIAKLLLMIGHREPPLPASSIPRVFVVPKVMNVLGHPCAKPPELQRTS